MVRNNYVNNCKSNKNELWEQIITSSFALDDIKLYLDTHPCDGDAINSYNEYKRIRKAAIKEYVKNFGPISAYDVDVDNYWEWVNAPWPWEGGC